MFGLELFGLELVVVSLTSLPLGIAMHFSPACSQACSGRRVWRLAAAVMGVCLTSGTVVHAATVYSITSTSGDTLTGTFTFAGSLASDGTFNFGTDGSPLSSPSFTATYLLQSRAYQVTSTGTMSGSFTMTGVLADGRQDFASDGSPLSSPTFSWSGGSASNQPNQNDDYLVSGGLVTAMKYDLSGLSLQIDGSYAIGDFFSPTETGTYTVTAGAPSFGSASFSNPPNHNDTYVVAGGSLTAMKYDLFGGGDLLLLRADGSFAVSDGLQTVGSGTYALAPVPEPATLGMAVAAIAAGCWWRFRRRRSN